MENNDASGSGSGGDAGSGGGSAGSGAGGASAAGGSGRRDEHASGADDDSSRPGLSVPEALKKLFTAGVTAAFMTEESIRSFVSEMRLPKETVHLLLQGAAKSKEDLMNRVGREVIGMISKIDFVKEASRFVEEHKFKVSAEIEVLRKKKDSDPPA
jgi:hypothetical protein